MSPESNADLDRIYLEIAEAGFPDNAYAFTGKITDFCHELRTFPYRGTARPRIQPQPSHDWFSPASDDRIPRS
jgi:toxin ParE1/3/4